MSVDFQKTEIAEFYQQMGIEVGRRCNARCEHCISFSGPKNHAQMEFGLMKRVIEQSAESGLQHLELTGGEPFLFRDQLEQILQMAYESGMSIGITTNSFWAKTIPAAEALLEKLKRLGLARLRFSIDRYHLNYIPFECVKNAVQAALKTDIKCIVEATVGRKDYQMYGAIKELKQFPMELRVSALLPYGKAADLPPETFMSHSFFSVANTPCLTAGTPVVQLDGRVLLCCVVPVAQDPNDMESPFVLGNAKQESIVTILTRHFRNPLLRVLRYQGPGGLMRALQKKYGAEQYTARDSYPGGICTLCGDMMNNQKLREMWHLAVADNDPNSPAVPFQVLAEQPQQQLVTIAPFKAS